MKQLYKDIWKAIIKNKKITILTHINADGDTVGSAVALKQLILTNTSGIDVKISGEKVPAYLSLFDENDIVSDEYFNNSQIVVVDTSNKKRVFDKRLVTKEAIKIDHHHEEEEWLLGVGGDHWPATGEVLYNLAQANNLDISKRTRAAIFVAIWTDTEGLTQRNFTDKTKKILESLDVDKKMIINSLKAPRKIMQLTKSLKKKMVISNNVGYLYYDETEVDNDYLRLITGELSNMSGFDVYFGMVKTDKHMFRGSIRSKINFDVSKFAKMLHGGGHFNSAGFSEQNLDVVTDVLRLIKEELAQNKL
ncbi:DHH family phosphoesterase [Candidatus Mycoplasma mahonii]|uniref:DHH family phosphoesterase n=1 Tax=Candidatus Mycoplasma mahonii TaxID=3004105 RepID=UPI0026EE363D|nr:DHH family phosphoesterase [Candidatus Mycoplasma mahonii]WKX02464.1 DHH family phosphoesterase [Candidatus Mycoplasma mahonii]